MDCVPHAGSASQAGEEFGSIRNCAPALWSNTARDNSPRRQAWSTTISTQEQSMSSRVKAVLDPSHDVLRYERRALDPIFQPKSVAVGGAPESAGGGGGTIVWDMTGNS